MKYIVDKPADMKELQKRLKQIGIEEEGDFCKKFESVEYSTLIDGLIFKTHEYGCGMKEFFVPITLQLLRVEISEHDEVIQDKNKVQKKYNAMVYTDLAAFEFLNLYCAEFKVINHKAYEEIRTKGKKEN